MRFRTLLVMFFLMLLSSIAHGERLEFSEHDNLPIFQADYYLRMNPDVEDTFGENNYGAARWHYDHYGKAEGRRSSPSFHVKDYLELNPDVEAAFGNDYLTALWHFTNYGISEGRQSTHGFHVKHYLSINRDLLRSLGVNTYREAHLNWADYGLIVGLASTSQFHVAAYLDYYEELLDLFGQRDFADAYIHWLTHGRIQNRYGGRGKNIASCTGVPEFTGGPRVLSARGGQRNELLLNMSQRVTRVNNRWNGAGAQTLKILVNPYNNRQVSISLDLQLFPSVPEQIFSWYFEAENSCGSGALSGEVELVSCEGGRNCDQIVEPVCSGRPEYQSGQTSVPRGGSTAIRFTQPMNEATVYDNGSGVTADVSGNSLTLRAPAGSSATWYSVEVENDCGVTSFSGSIQ